MALSRTDFRQLIGSILFCFVFVCLQVLNFVNIVPFNIKTFVPYLMTAVVLYIGWKLPLNNNCYRAPRMLYLLSIFGAVLSVFAGNGLGDMLLKIMYATFGFVGYVYVCERKINLNLFPIILLLAYVYFYRIFFFDQANLRVGDFFEISSSNTIAISLNVIFYFYYLLQKYYQSIDVTKLIIFSCTNLAFIWVQGSRIGVAVALLFVMLSLLELLIKKGASKGSFFVLFFIALVGIVLLYSKFSYLLDAFVEDNGAIGLNAYEEDCRSGSQHSFFANLNAHRFLLGYNIDFAFYGDLHRTFNSFLDFWARYTIIPFVYLVYRLMRRLFSLKDFSIPVYALIPFFLYGFVESLWSGALWDIFLYLICFLSDRSIENNKIAVNENSTN